MFYSPVQLYTAQWIKIFARPREKKLEKELSLANSGVLGKHRANIRNLIDAEREGTIQFSQNTLRSKYGTKYLTFSVDRKPKKWQGNSDGERKTTGREKGTENYDTERIVMERDSAKYKLVFTRAPKRSGLLDWFWLMIFRTNLARGPWIRRWNFHRCHWLNQSQNYLDQLSTINDRP